MNKIAKSKITGQSDHPDETDSLRFQAEAELAHAPQAQTQTHMDEELLHELRVHQIELEMQNEELRRAHLALEESRDRYVDLYEFAPIGYFTLTRDGLVAEVNLTGAEMLGVMRDKLLKHRFAPFVAPEDGDHWHRCFLLVTQHGDRQGCELTFKRADGSRFRAQVNFLRSDTGNPFSNNKTSDDGSLVRVVIADITDRKWAKEELKENERRYALTLDAADLGTWDWDIKTGRVVFNERWAEMRGYPLDQIEPHISSWENDIHPDDLPAVRATLNRHFENRIPFFQAEYRVRAQTGLWVWILDRSTVIKRDVEGNPLHMVGTGMDITERKHAEEELRIAATAFDSQQGMIVTDPDGVIMRVNQAFTRLTGYSAAEAIGQTPAMLQSGRQDKDFYRRMWETLKQKRYWQGEMWNKRKDGKIYAEWLTISAVNAPCGNISHYVGTFSVITENKEAEARIHRLAYYDELTSLPNRRLLLDRLEQAMAFSRRHLRYGAILFLDLDNFKALNDTRGHDVGDLLLTEIAQRLQAAVREGDSIARLGGDEFVVLLEDLSEDVAEAVVQVGLVGAKVQEIITAPYMLKDIEFHCTTSIGACLFGGHDESVDTLLRHADLAMYQAKKSGGNNLRFFDPEMQATLDERTAIESDLRQALVKQQFRLYYQIQVTSTRRVIGAETLLRWEHPERGLISPLQFIPLAEENGLIVPIGLWVLHTACAQIKDWSGQPATRDLQLAVNVSPRQFHQADFVSQVHLALAESGINPARLKIELTESMMLDNVSDTIAKMRAIRALGVGFSMDDFGTGYSSLSYLKRLPLDQLKIDRSFVMDITTDPNDAAIIQTIIGMAHNLSLNVIAEGVETETQLELLNQYSCRAYQGYLFSKPVPVREFEKLLVQYA